MFVPIVINVSDINDVNWLAKPKLFIEKNTVIGKASYISKVAQEKALFKNFELEVKDKYGLKVSDRINKMLDNISTLQTFLDVLK